MTETNTIEYKQGLRFVEQLGSGIHRILNAYIKVYLK